jgi:hypothetical protein
MEGVMNKSSWFALLVLIASSASAGDQVGSVRYVRVRAADGLVYFSLSGTKTNSPGCSTNDYWIVRDENSNSGKQHYAMLLAAQLSGRIVAVSGLNTCARWLDGEDANEVRIIE